MRIWVDLTGPAHPVVLAPVVRRLRAAGHDVAVTARDYAQTLALAERLGLDARAVGHHGGRGLVGKARALAGRSAALTRWARGREFGLAICHGSNDLPIASALLRIPAVDMFDYEWATLQHQIGCRLSRRVLVPDAIPADRLARYGARPPKLVRYAGLKEEYYLADWEPDPQVAPGLGVDPARILVVVRTPPEASMYHRHANPLFPRLIERLGRDEGVHAVVVPRLDAQREELRARGLPSLIIPDGAVDGPSLVAAADLVVSAGGTMNREAVALGVPVYSTFSGRPGAVDEQLVREGRLRLLSDPDAVVLERRAPAGARVRRDPQVWIDHMLAAAA